jgi:hypothetical protein
LNFRAHLLQRLFAASRDKHARAQRGKMQRHRPAQSGAASGKKNRAAFEHVFIEHQ